MRGKIIIPMYRLWLHALYGQYGPQCPLIPKKADKLKLSISLHFDMVQYNTVLYAGIHLRKKQWDANQISW